MKTPSPHRPTWTCALLTALVAAAPCCLPMNENLEDLALAGNSLASASTGSADANQSAADANLASGSGAAGGDANSSGSGQIPTPSPAPFNCDEANYPVCDGFETQAVGQPPNPARWNSQVSLPPPDDGAVHNDFPSQNTILISDKLAHTGTQSLHLHSSPGWAHLPIQAITSTAYPKDFFPAPHNTFFVRLWIYSDGHDGDHGVSVGSGHWYLVNASGPLAGRQQYQKFGGGGDTLGWNYFGNDQGLGSNVPFPVGTWTCFEVAFHGPTQELVVYMNDEAVPGLSTQSWAAPAYNRLTVGWEMDHPAGDYPGLDVYIDDVAFAYSRIGCKVAVP